MLRGRVGQAVKGRATDGIESFVTTRLFDEEILSAKDPSYPKITIVTPSFNQGRFIERTILSVLNQNYPNLEYIVIDGGSTDGSVETIKQYEQYLAYWVSEPDKGQGDALNKGFSRATGEFVGWQNSDDIYLPNAFLKVMEVFRERPEVEIAFSNRLDVDEENNIIGESRFTPFSVVRYWYEGMSLSNQSIFWRREVFSKIGMIDPGFRLAMDYEFFLRAGLQKLKFKHVRDYWGAIRRHRDSKTSTLWDSYMMEECEIINRRFGRKEALAGPLKLYSLLWRCIYHLSQGDMDYLRRGLKRRTALGLSQRFFRGMEPERLDR